MNYIKRSLESIVREASAEYPVVLVTGPSQVGKTTIAIKTQRKSILFWNGMVN